MSDSASADVGPHFLPQFLPVPGPADHKYTRGVVALATGSEAYPGAALLGAQVATRCGVGMVRYAGPGGVAGMVVQRVPEVVPAPGRAQVWVLGSGWDVSSPETEADAAERFMETTSFAAETSADAFFVLDAGVLQLIEGFADGAEHAILTPHAGEANALLTRLDVRPRNGEWSRERIESEPVTAATALAELTHATVILKGHTTVVAAPGEETITIVAPTARLATAGTGDVLAAMVGAVLALNHASIHAAAERGERSPVMRACAAAVELHGWSALEASNNNAGNLDAVPGVHNHAPIVAHDLSHAAPAVIARFTAP